MDAERLQPMLEDLEGNIDELEEALDSLLSMPLNESTAKLPLLDKAKLYVLSTYAIESILFSVLRLNGVNAKEHSIFRELTRVKQYFDKIKDVEAGPVGLRENLRLDKDAAARFIRAGLAGNDAYDKRRAELQAREKAAAKAKVDEMREKSGTGKHIRFDEEEKEEGAKAMSKAEGNPARTTHESSSDEDLKVHDGVEDIDMMEARQQQNASVEKSTAKDGAPPKRAKKDRKRKKEKSGEKGEPSADRKRKKRKAKAND